MDYAIELCVSRAPEPKVFDRSIVTGWPFGRVVERAKTSLAVWPVYGKIYEGDHAIDVMQIGLDAVFVRVIEISRDRVLFQTSLAQLDYRPNPEPPDL
jgi:hypothetical protein